MTLRQLYQHPEYPDSYIFQDENRKSVIAEPVGEPISVLVAGVSDFFERIERVRNEIASMEILKRIPKGADAYLIWLPKTDFSVRPNGTNVVKPRTLESRFPVTFYRVLSVSPTAPAGGRQ